MLITHGLIHDLTLISQRTLGPSIVTFTVRSFEKLAKTQVQILIFTPLPRKKKSDLKY